MIDAPPDRRELLFKVMTETNIIEQLSRNAFERAQPNGLRISQFGVLVHLIRRPGEWSPARIASAFQVTKGAMTNTLGRLEERELITVKPNPADGRGKLVAITQAGREAYATATMASAPGMRKIAEQFSEKELSALLGLLSRMREHLDEARN